MSDACPPFAQVSICPRPKTRTTLQWTSKRTRANIRRRPVEQESYLSKEQLQALRKVQHERIEVCPFIVAAGECGMR
jgi:hypothetical protein